MAGVAISSLGDRADAVPAPSVQVTTINQVTDHEVEQLLVGTSFPPATSLTITASAGASCTAPGSVFATRSVSSAADGTFQSFMAFDNGAGSGSGVVCVTET